MAKSRTSRKGVSALDALDEATSRTQPEAAQDSDQASEEQPGKYRSTSTGYVNSAGVERVRRCLLLTKEESLALDIAAAKAGHSNQISKFIVEKLELGSE